MTMPPHRPVNPQSLVSPSGFSHGIVADEGRSIWVAGQIGVDDQGVVTPGGFVAQFDQALANVVRVVDAAGGEPEHIVAMTIYTTAMNDYRSSLGLLGPVWRDHMGRHYPAVAMLGVTELVEPDALVEIVAVAVVPPGL